MNKKIISVKNFRVFKGLTKFEIRPLTILVGPNNSGKSSLTKLILAFQNSLNNIDFDKENNHNLESFSKIISWGSDDENLVLRPVNKFIELEEELTFQITYNKNSLSLIEILNAEDDTDLFSVSKGGEIFINIQYLIELFYNNLINEKKQSLNQPYEYGFLLFELFKNDKNITDVFEDEILDFQREFSYSLINSEKFFYLTELDEFNFEILDKCIELLASEIEDKLIDRLNDDELTIKLSELGEKIFGKSLDEDKSTFLTKIFKYSKLNNILGDDEIHYISANRGNHKRVLQNKSSFQIDEIVAEYSKIKHKFWANSFIEKSLSTLGIEGKLVIPEMIENSLSIVYLEINNRQTNLADLGFGYSQILPIILKIATIIGQIEKTCFDLGLNLELDEFPNLSNNFTFILEEPEANLHPNLQSKFADFLAFIVKEYKGFNFLIETHSEYLIRKLQFLTAKEALNTDDTVIHYFNEDKNVSIKEPKVKQIFINLDGGLTSRFGSGFFDETTKLQFDLLTLNKQQYN